MVCFLAQANPEAAAGNSEKQSDGSLPHQNPEQIVTVPIMIKVRRCNRTPTSEHRLPGELQTTTGL